MFLQQGSPVDEIPIELTGVPVTDLVIKNDLVAATAEEHSGFWTSDLATKQRRIWRHKQSYSPNQHTG